MKKLLSLVVLLALLASCTGSKKFAALEQRQAATAASLNEAIAAGDTLRQQIGNLSQEVATAKVAADSATARALRAEAAAAKLVAAKADTVVTDSVTNPLSARELVAHFQKGGKVFATWKGRTRPCEAFGFSHPNPEKTGFRFYAKTVPFKADGGWHMKISWEADKFQLRVWEDVKEKKQLPGFQIVSHNLDSKEPFRLVLKDGSVVTFSKK